MLNKMPFYEGINIKFNYWYRFFVLGMLKHNNTTTSCLGYRPVYLYIFRVISNISKNIYRYI